MLLFAGLACPLAAAQCVYEVNVIEGTDCTWYTVPLDIRDLGPSGRLCGHMPSCDFEREIPVHQQPGGPLEILDLGDDAFVRAYPAAIAASGTIVGRVEFAVIEDGVASTVFVHHHGSTSLIDVPAGGNYADAAAVSNDGAIIAGTWGNFITGEPAARAFCIERGRFLDVAAMLGEHESSWANDLEAAGGRTVVGTVLPDAGSPRSAFLANLDAGTVTVLEVPDAVRTEARAVAGPWVAGFAHIAVGTADPLRRAIRWDAEGVASILEPLEAGGETRIGDVCTVGTVVGWTLHEATGTRATLWPPGSVHGIDLNDHLEGAPAGLVIEFADAIDHGTIVGQARLDGRPVGVRLTPVERPAEDLTGDCRVDASDLDLLLAVWGSSDPVADLDGDALVGVRDLLALLSAWR